MSILVSLKDYLADRPETAFLALTLCALFYMFKKYDASVKAQIKMAFTLAPLVEKLVVMVSEDENPEDENNEV
ncbi:MAG TPA: hypothetical protein VMW36_01215 [Patescibacteria group bacterium]|nr:hypothetical protein [Patescibacteria group bacterium]